MSLSFELHLDRESVRLYESTLYTINCVDLSSWIGLDLNDEFVNLKMNSLTSLIA